MAAFHRLIVADVRRETADAVSVGFAVPPELAAAYRFQPGQHLTLKCVIDGVEQRRSYSICSGIDEGHLRIAVKRQPGGKVSGWINRDLRAGDAIEVMTPTGRFTLPLDAEAARNYVALAAGSGITPVIGLLKSVLGREAKSRFLLVYGNRSAASILFREELEDLKNRHMTRLTLLHVLSAEDQDSPLLTGRIEPGTLLAMQGRLYDPAAVERFLLCGPRPMIETLAEALATQGVERRRILSEHFVTPGEEGALPVPRPTLPEAARRHGLARIVIVKDGRRSEFAMGFEGESIVDAARRHGHELPFSCKSGVCSTCRCKKRAGEVSMARNYALEPWELEAGFVLACQSRPASELVELDFDTA
ncbi:MAG: 2Fe-2S iron-sulfur cluster binding domain-containing protein [Alphaproteobacteria bacterium]|nr:2Fe-2S iron-sulfur cluster binding domain-containing protein [Alphaproteobacteria bacterium]